MDDQTDDGKSANTTIHRLVQPTHGQKLLDEGDQDRHCRVAVFPIQEGSDGIDPTKVLKRHVHLEARTLVNVLDDGHFCPCDDLDAAMERLGPDTQLVHNLPHKASSRFVELFFSAFKELLGNKGHVHISRGKIEARRERAKRVDIIFASPCAADQGFQPVDKLMTKSLFEGSGPDVIVKIHNLSVQTRKRELVTENLDGTKSVEETELSMSNFKGNPVGIPILAERCLRYGTFIH